MLSVLAKAAAVFSARTTTAWVTSSAHSGRGVVFGAFFVLFALFSLFPCAAITPDSTWLPSQVGPVLLWGVGVVGSAEIVLAECVFVSLYLEVTRTVNGLRSSRTATTVAAHDGATTASGATHSSPTSIPSSSSSSLAAFQRKLFWLSAFMVVLAPAVASIAVVGVPPLVPFASYCSGIAIFMVAVLVMICMHVMDTRSNNQGDAANAAARTSKMRSPTSPRGVAVRGE